MTHDTQPADADYGELERSTGQPTVRFTRRLAHPPEKVWRALTEPDHLAGWFPTTIDGELAAGSKLSFAFPPELAIPPMDGEMLTFDPPELMEMIWGDETLRFELTPDGAGTVLRFSASFDELGKMARDGAGWHESLDRMACALEGRSAPWQPEERWRLIHPRYVESFGPEASTIGPPKEWEDVYGQA